MASIKGFQLKGLKHFEGRNAPGVQGNIYVDGKKVGWYNDDGSGTTPEIEFCYCGERRNEFQTRLETAKKEYFSEHQKDGAPKDFIPDDEFFFYRLLHLIDDEKYYKKMLKNGYPFLLIYKKQNHDIYEQIIGFQTETGMTDFIEKNRIGKHKAYRSLKDFDI